MAGNAKNATVSPAAGGKGLHDRAPETKKGMVVINMIGKRSMTLFNATQIDPFTVAAAKLTHVLDIALAECVWLLLL